MHIKGCCISLMLTRACGADKHQARGIFYFIDVKLLVKPPSKTAAKPKPPNHAAPADQGGCTATLSLLRLADSPGQMAQRRRSLPISVSAAFAVPQSGACRGSGVAGSGVIDADTGTKFC